MVDELSAAMNMSAYGGAMSGDMFQLLKEGAEQVLAQAKARVEAQHVPVDTLLIEGFAGRLSDHVIEQTRLWAAELVVVGSHGRRGVGRLVMGSDAEQIIRTSVVPVLVVRAPDTPR